MTDISGYNVSSIESLIYVRDQTGIDVGQLLFAGILIASLGAVMDVAMSISSTIEEISHQNPELGVKVCFFRNACWKRYDGNHVKYINPCLCRRFH